MENKKPVYINGRPGHVSDGFHTFDELYDHRSLLFITLANHLKETSWKSLKHEDGSRYDDWFIAGMELEKSGTITYHIHIKKWDLCHFKELEKAPKWDGHTANDILDRLENFIKTNQ